MPTSVECVQVEAVAWPKTSSFWFPSNQRVVRSKQHVGASRALVNETRRLKQHEAEWVPSWSTAQASRGRWEKERQKCQQACTLWRSVNDRPPARQRNGRRPGFSTDEQRHSRSFFASTEDDDGVRKERSLSAESIFSALSLF